MMERKRRHGTIQVHTIIPGFSLFLMTQCAACRDSMARMLLGSATRTPGPPTGADGATIRIHGNTASFHQE